MAARPDLEARLLGLEGNIRARMGEVDAGLELVRAGLTFALERNHTGAAAEIYQRLADSLEHCGDYRPRARPTTRPSATARRTRWSRRRSSVWRA